MNSKITLLVLSFLFILPLSAAEEDNRQPDATIGQSTVGNTDYALTHEAYRPPRRALRAYLEGGALHTISTANYWNQYFDFVEDWQYQLNWKDQKKRFFTLQANRFDSNNFPLNWGHALSGMVYYSFYRTNGYSYRHSWMMAAATSLAWEYITEWREVISINDNINTGIGGPAIAENLYQIGLYYNGKRGLANQIAGFITNPMLAINQLLNGKHRTYRSGELDPWHDFRLYTGLKDGPASPGANEGRQLQIGLDMKIIAPPVVGKTGDYSFYRRDTMATRLRFDLAASNKGVEEYRANAGTMWSGLFRQRITAADDGTLRGYTFILGWGTGFDLMKKRSLVNYDGRGSGFSDPRKELPRPTAFTDKYAIVDLLGPMAVARFYGRDTEINLRGETYLDFAMINAFALNPYTVDHEISGAKTTIVDWGYHYALGVKFVAEASIRWRNFELALAGQYFYFDSIEGKDRFPDKVTDNFNIVDSRRQLDAGLTFHVPRTPFTLSAVYEGVNRYGRIRAVERREREDRFFYRLSWKF